MLLSVLEAMSILRPMEQNLARLGLPAYSRSNDDDETDGKVWQKWLDSLASLLVGSSPGSLSNQSRCIVTIAFNVRSTRSGDVHKLVHSIWNWMKDASVLPEEDSKKNGELFGIILEASLDRIRRRLKDKGKFVGPLIAKAEEANLTELQKTFLMTAHLLHVDILQRLGPDVEKPDFRMASKAFRFRVKAYEAAKSKQEDFYWLHPFESQMVKSEAKLPSLVCYVDKLQKPYSQYVLIRKAVRKSFIRDALSIPLHVNVLPSPDPAPGSAFQSMVTFETRVWSYLTVALLSYSTDAAGSSFAEGAIDFFWHRIQKVVDANQGRTPYPYFGVSKLSCFQCALYFQVYRACELRPSFQTRGSHVEVFACALPACDRGHDKADEAIGNEMGTQLENIIGQLLAVEINGRRKMSLSSVDSTGSSPNSPPSDEEYVDVLKIRSIPATTGDRVQAFVGGPVALLPKPSSITFPQRRPMWERMEASETDLVVCEVHTFNDLVFRIWGRI
ncbi:hypothetical protein C8J57DRAFT_1230207 [Mycena rebaudengoi]|nr:hypothetical protein C8J57DRAFT_1230207 [Mycena rebaudengoi]